MAVLGLRFCARAFSSCGKWGPLFIAVRGPLIIAASLVADHRLQTRRLSSCGSRAQLLRGMWDLPRPGLEPTSPALAGRLSTTAPPGKPYKPFLIISISKCYGGITLLFLIFTDSHSFYFLKHLFAFVIINRNFTDFIMYECWKPKLRRLSHRDDFEIYKLVQAVWNQYAAAYVVKHLKDSLTSFLISLQEAI